MKSDFLSLLKSHPDLNNWLQVQTSGQSGSDILSAFQQVDSWGDPGVY